MKRYIAIIPALIILSHICPAYSQEKPVKCDVLLKQILSEAPVDEAIPDSLPSDEENQPSAQQALSINS